jgi:hypothetical protein
MLGTYDLIKLWVDGVNIYLRDYERCGYEFRPGIPCTVRGRYNHLKHVYTPNNSTQKPALQEKGDFQMQEGQEWSDDDKAEWIAALSDNFCNLFRSIFPEGQLDVAEMRIQALRKTIQRQHDMVWRVIRSTKTCLCCLQAVPDHTLPCGHSYCSQCVQEIGNPAEFYEFAYNLAECSLCGENKHHIPHLIRLKPRCAGVRLLTLDGGGIRGIVELAVLKAIHGHIGLGISVSELFDLVVGTSTGKIVSFWLLRSGYSACRCAILYLSYIYRVCDQR